MTPRQAQWRARFRAALIHASGSGLVAALAAALVFFLWYPTPYEKLAGGASLFVLVISVDVVMGPMITFAIYDPRKRKAELGRDLAVVVALQLAALGYGLHTMFIARPVVMALEGSRFRVVAAIDVAEGELPHAPPNLQTLSLTGPRLVRTADVDPSDRLEAIEKAIAGNDVGTRPKYWRSWDDIARRDVRDAAKPLADLLKRYPEHRPIIETYVAKTKVSPEFVRYLPIVARHAQAVALVDARSGDVVGFAPYDAF